MGRTATAEWVRLVGGVRMKEEPKQESPYALKDLWLAIIVFASLLFICSQAGKGLAVLIGPIPGLNCEVVSRIVNEDSETRKTITVEECEKVP